MIKVAANKKNPPDSIHFTADDDDGSGVFIEPPQQSSHTKNYQTDDNTDSSSVRCLHRRLWFDRRMSSIMWQRREKKKTLYGTNAINLCSS